MLSTHFSIINCRLYKWLQKEKKKEQGGETRALDKLGSIYTWENIATAYSQEVAARSSENLKSWKFKLLCKIQTNHLSKRSMMSLLNQLIFLKAFKNFLQT